MKVSGRHERRVANIARPLFGILENGSGGEVITACHQDGTLDGEESRADHGHFVSEVGRLGGNEAGRAVQVAPAKQNLSESGDGEVAGEIAAQCNATA